MIILVASRGPSVAPGTWAEGPHAVSKLISPPRIYRLSRCDRRPLCDWP